MFPEEGTEIEFEISPKGDGTEVRFSHSGFGPPGLNVSIPVQVHEAFTSTEACGDL